MEVYEPDLDESFGDVHNAEIHVVKYCTRVLEEWRKVTKTVLESELKKEKFCNANIHKPVLAKWLEEAASVMCGQSEMISNMLKTISLAKMEALEDRATIIRLQAELLESKDKQLDSLKATVQNTVKETVSDGIKSYSAAVKNNTPAFSPESLKKVVKSAIEEEDRSKNVVIFGLPEEDGEQLESRIGELFLQLDEKPRVAVSRVGRISPGEQPRPVKVTLPSSIFVNQILTKSPRLKQMQRFKSVFVNPDRSPHERAARKKLVEELKKREAQQPNRTHFIKGGQVHSIDKTAT